MKNLLNKYLRKLSLQGLARPDDVAFLGIDDQVFIAGGLLDKEPLLREPLLEVTERMNINSLLLAIPTEPMRSIIDELLHWGRTGNGLLLPRDTETRTFLHDIPVVKGLKPDEIVEALSHRKSVIVESMGGIVTYGTISPEQAFVFMSSTCFSLFVKYFHDHIRYLKEAGKRKEKARIENFNLIREMINAPGGKALDISVLDKTDNLRYAIETAGKLSVEENLVDSSFGNISSCLDGIIYISETASSLDELEDAIDEVPMDGLSSVGITASSELPAHRGVYGKGRHRFILHGHPRFTVIGSMLCERDCDDPDLCYRGCPEERYLCGVPIVSGEVGTGPYGIVNTVPRALESTDAVIVYGHGIFTAGEDSFREPFNRMLEVERCAMREYFRQVDAFHNRNRSSPRK